MFIVCIHHPVLPVSDVLSLHRYDLEKIAT